MTDLDRCKAFFAEHGYIEFLDHCESGTWKRMENPSWDEDVEYRVPRPRALFGGGITAEAEKYNAPRHFGRAMLALMEAYNDGTLNETEILPVKKGNPRRIKARRKKETSND